MSIKSDDFRRVAYFYDCKGELVVTRGDGQWIDGSES
jgi:hypothetical protein